jgi:thiol-disulfide isomerase/thioredoxin
MRRVWTNRWVRALAVAAVVAAWPACNRNAARPGAEAARLDFVLQDMHGQDVRLADYKGRPLLINFWATWCGPCKAEIPWFTEFAEKYAPQKFAVLGISVDDTAEDIKPFAEKFRVTYPMLVGKGHDDLMAAYGAGQFIPVSWLVRPDGTVHVKATGIHEKAWFEQQIASLLDE